jgi:hypothetical protein
MAGFDSTLYLDEFQDLCHAIAGGGPCIASDLLPAEAAGEPPSPLAQLRWILRDAHHPLRAAVLRDPLAPHIK